MHATIVRVPWWFPIVIYWAMLAIDLILSTAERRPIDQAFLTGWHSGTALPMHLWALTLRAMQRAQ